MGYHVLSIMRRSRRGFVCNCLTSLREFCVFLLLTVCSKLCSRCHRVELCVCHSWWSSISSPALLARVHIIHDRVVTLACLPCQDMLMHYSKTQMYCFQICKRHASRGSKLAEIVRTQLPVFPLSHAARGVRVSHLFISLSLIHI